MKMITEICKKCIDNGFVEKEDSAEYSAHIQKSQKIYEELSQTLCDEQRKKLFAYYNENCLLEGQHGQERFLEGKEKGFKMAVRLLFDCMRDD